MGLEGKESSVRRVRNRGKNMGVLRAATTLAALLITLVSAAPSQVDVFTTCMSPLSVNRPGGTTYGRLVSLGYVTKRWWPAAVVLANSTSDVSQAVKCARRISMKVCARSGGHAFDGRSLCNDILIDLGGMKKTTVNAAGIATIDAGATTGESLWKVHEAGRWYAAGVCPAVGIAGYLLGGGHSPYEGRLGVACDSLEEVTMVTRDGAIVLANRKVRQRLFWGMCGAGGAQFGIVTKFRLRTVSSRPYDNAVIFSYRWPHERIGELIASYAKYGESGGNVWVRINMSDRRKYNPGMRALGVCFDVASTEACEARLRKGAFFHVPGRERLLIAKARSALDVHGFFGPGGAWGRRFPRDLWKSLAAQRYTMKGGGDRVTDQSAFLTLGANPPSAAYWQRYADYCADAPLKSKPWRTCQMNLFQNAIDTKRFNAFPHRGANIIAHFAIGMGSIEDRRRAYYWMKTFLKPITSGVYVNYQEPGLGKIYPNMYWGKSLRELRLLKAKYDPNYFFANPQPIHPAFR